MHILPAEACHLSNEDPFNVNPIVAKGLLETTCTLKYANISALLTRDACLKCGEVHEPVFPMTLTANEERGGNNHLF